MTRENAILCLKGIKNYGRDTFTEQSDWQESLDMAIKALEQQSCEDCVSRQVVIELAEKGVLVSNGNYKSVCNAINELPSVTPQSKWIACSERLPENDEVVLGTNSSNDLFKTYTWDDCGEIKWYADGCFDVPVIAWMPLPEPYKEDEEK